MEFAPDAMPWNSLYKLLIGSILPRPIGWISTVDAGGSPNLAPYSFFNAVCPNPPTVLFCPMIRNRDGAAKDTLANCRATGEFVVNIVGGALAEKMNATSGEYPPDANEFEIAGLTAAPSTVVRPPRVAESLIHFDCRVSQIVDVGDGTPGSGSIVIGQILHIHIDESVLLDGDKVRLDVLQPIGRLAGADYVRVTDIFSMIRPAVK